MKKLVEEAKKIGYIKDEQLPEWKLVEKYRSLSFMLKKYTHFTTEDTVSYCINDFNALYNKVPSWDTKGMTVVMDDNANNINGPLYPDRSYSDVTDLLASFEEVKEQTLSHLREFKMKYPRWHDLPWHHFKDKKVKHEKRSNTFIGQKPVVYSRERKVDDSRANTLPI